MKKAHTFIKLDPQFIQSPIWSREEKQLCKIMQQAISADVNVLCADFKDTEWKNKENVPMEIIHIFYPVPTTMWESDHLHHYFLSELLNVKLS